MPRPGTDIRIVDDQAPGGPSLDTGQAFFVGVASRGPTDRALSVKSLRDFERNYGDRSGASLLYDGANGFFSEGGGTLHVARAVGAGAVSATLAFGDLTATASSPGAWGNELTVTATAPDPLAGAPAGAIVVTVELDDELVDVSPTLASIDAATSWRSDYVVLDGVASDTMPPVDTTATLAGGADGAAATAAELEAALELFEYALGPGQVAAPGWTSSGAHDALLAHIDATKRCALLDLPDTPTALTLSTAVTRLYGKAGARFAAAFAPFAEYPGPAAPSTVLVPYSGVQAGLLARSDALGNANQPAAGVNGVSRAALGLSQTYTDDEREALNEAGVTTAKLVYGDVRTYGGRTVAGPDDSLWLWFGNSRVIMAIAHESDAIAENYVLRQIDGRGQLFAALESDLRGMLLRYFNANALYGETAPEAFYVDTSDKVNTLETIAAGEVHAAIFVKCSPSAEWVRIDIVKVPIERALPTAA